MRGRVPGSGVVQGLVLKGLKIIPVLFRGASGVGDPVDDKRLYTGQLFPGPGKGIDRQQVSLYVHALSIASRRDTITIIAVNVFLPEKSCMLLLP
jgi:hypothetical protein